MKKLLSLLIIASLLTLGAYAVVAAPGGKGDGKGPAAQEDNGHTGCLPGDAFENDDVRLWFQGHKGHVKVFDKRDNATALVYDYQTKAITETSGGASVADINLGRAFPHDSGCTIEESGEWVNVTFHVTFDVDGTTGQSVGTSDITFVWHFNKTSQGAKFDLFVADWPWQAEDSELSFDFSVTSAYTIEQAENGLGFRDGTDSRGYIEWAPNATATYADGHNETAIVQSDTTGSEHHVDVRLAFTNVTAGYTLLDYDPWLGVGDYVIVAGVLIGLGPVQALLPAPARPLYDLVGRLL